MPRRKKTICHVNQHVIKANGKTGARNPVLTIKQGRRNRYAHEVEILGPSRLVYRPDRPLPCGARVWIETYAEVLLDPPSQATEEPSVSEFACAGPAKLSKVA